MRDDATTMKPTPILTTSALVLTTLAGVCAEDKPAPIPAPPPPPALRGSPGLLNEFLRAQSDAWKPWDIGGQLRARYEFKGDFAVAGTAGAVDFAKNSPQDENSYLLFRE